MFFAYRFNKYLYKLYKICYNIYNNIKRLGMDMKNGYAINQTMCLLLLIAIILTLAFIFGNSIVSMEESEQISNHFNESIGNVITALTGKEETALENFLIQYSRKIAHFVEFACLGIEVILLLHFAFRRNLPYLLLGATLSFTVASFDEGIQVLTGRGDQVSDIFIDVSGYMSAYLLGMTVLYLCAWRHTRKTLSAIPAPKK